MSLRDWFHSDFEIKLVTPGKGDGPSSTRYVYLRAGALSVYAAFLATTAAVAVYMMDGHKADAVFLGFAGALWLNALGFASNVKKHQIANARDPNAQAPAAPGSNP